MVTLWRVTGFTSSQRPQIIWMDFISKNQKKQKIFLFHFVFLPLKVDWLWQEDPSVTGRQLVCDQRPYPMPSGGLSLGGLFWATTHLLFFFFFFSLLFLLRSHNLQPRPPSPPISSASLLSVRKWDAYLNYSPLLKTLSARFCPPLSAFQRWILEIIGQWVIFFRIWEHFGALYSFA